MQFRREPGPAGGRIPAGRFALLPAVTAVAVLLVVALFAGMWTSPVLGADLTPEQESLAKEIEGELIAPCCYTQTVADHDSSAAEEMRAGIRSMIASGATKDEVIEFYKDRYGAEILAAPEKSGFDLMAYVFPGLMTVLALAVLVVMLLRWRSRDGEAVPAVDVHAHPRGPDELRKKLDEELDRFDS